MRQSGHATTPSHITVISQGTATSKWLGVGAALALMLSACATLSPQEKSAYAQAQDQVQRLQSEPLANQAASKPLQEARDALSHADDAVKQHNAQQVLYWSYMASRRAEVGEAMVAELRTRNAVAQATAERARVQLQFQQRRADLAQSQAQQSRQRAQSAERQLQQERQQQQIAQVRQQAQQEVQQAQQAQQQAQQRAQQQAEQSQLVQQADKARRELAALKAKQTSQGMVLTLSGTPMFATGSDTLESGAVRSLQNVANLMQQHSMMKVRVEGFTDNRGSDQYNDALSMRRAQAVANALESDGVDPSRLEAIGRGESLPVASNNNAAGRQQNRRVELLFSDTQGRFASAQAGQQLR